MAGFFMENTHVEELDHSSQDDVNLDENEKTQEIAENLEQDPGQDQDQDDSPQNGKNPDASQDENEADENQPVEKQEPRKQRRASKRFQELANRANAWEEKALALKKQLQELQPSDDSDFDEYDMKQVADRSSRETAALMKTQQIEEAKESARLMQDQAQEVQLSQFSEAEQEFRSEASDYDQEIEKLGWIAERPHLKDLILSSDNGPRVAYYLAKNPNEARHVAQLAPLEAAKFVGGVEAKLTSRPIKKATDAPKPITKVTGKSTAISKDPAEMDFKEYERFRMQQIKGK